MFTLRVTFFTVMVLWFLFLWYTVCKGEDGEDGIREHMGYVFVRHTRCMPLRSVWRSPLEGTLDTFSLVCLLPPVVMKIDLPLLVWLRAIPQRAYGGSYVSLERCDFSPTTLVVSLSL